MRPEHIPEALRPALGPIFQQIGSLTERIRQYDRQLEDGLRRTLPRNGAPVPGRGDRAADGA